MTRTHQAIIQQKICERMTEDPNREPHEKETSIHTEGTSDRVTITSFKKTFFSKLVQHPEFELKWFNVLDPDSQEQTIESYSDLWENPGLTIIGVTGTLPIGAISIGVPRNSDSHAQVVKT